MGNINNKNCLDWFKHHIFDNVEIIKSYPGYIYLHLPGIMDSPRFDGEQFISYLIVELNPDSVNSSDNGGLNLWGTEWGNLTLIFKLPGEIVKEGDLVRVLLPYGENKKDIAVWVRVKFIDNDGSISGNIEKSNPFELVMEKDWRIGEPWMVQFNKKDILNIYEDWMQLCYSDNTTICTCPGICRNK